MIIQRRGDWLSAKVGEELVMMSVEKGTYLGLSDVGARIWELIEQPCSVDEVCARLLAEFEVTPDVCRDEVDAFLAELVRHGAASLEPPRSA